MSSPGVAIVLYCRAGFEGECAAEITTVAAGTGRALWCRAADGTGLVFAYSADGADLAAMLQQVAFDALVYARDWFAGTEVAGMAAGDRVAPILAALEGRRYNALRLTHADTGEGRGLSRLCKQMYGRVQGGLRDGGWLHARSSEVAEVLFVDGATAWVGYAPERNASPWPGGVPRLKLGGAPSRSAAKLDEAFIWFLGERADRLLAPGLQAVDLGAAPGGWTWQFVRRSIRVIAIDHGALRDDLIESGLVEHLREDAFRYRPDRPVDWLVCDIVDKPARVNARMLCWLEGGWCRRAIFNLKLPMNKRFAETQKLLGELQALPGWRIRARQLYHDREEITVFAERTKD